ncbi:MAG TPA: ketoacyl-ACP synthase III [Smithellaceae bacterium]|nr:ketoacyl-ACP synthase III [Smithellaceae bacterium]
MNIRDIAIALPAQRLDNKTIARWTDGDEDFIKNKIGVESRAFLREDESMIDLSLQACEKLFEQNRDLARDQIGLLIVVTQNPAYKIPHSSAILQNKLELSVNTACFDINLGCSGYVYALSVARALMLAEKIEEAVVVTCDPYSKIMGKADYETCSVFGDAATATRLSASRGAVIGRMDCGTDGAGAHHLMAKAGGSVTPHTGIWHANQAAAEQDDYHVQMNGRAIFNFMMKRVPSSVEACLQENGLSLDNIDYFFFHQASRYLIENLRDKMNLPPDKVPIEMENTGNTVSSSIPILIHNFMLSGLMQNKICLICGFGVGLSWATNIIFFGGKYDTAGSN